MKSKGFKKFMAMAYGIGAAVVILGALFKLQHWNYASEMLIAGLGTEAFIFFISAFEPLPKEELDWGLVYPELAGGEVVERETPEGVLSTKIDDMLAASNLDAEKLSKLTGSINNFTKATEIIGQSSVSISGTDKYNKQIEAAADHLFRINDIYANQETGMVRIQEAQDQVLQNQSDMIKSVAEKSSILTQQMEDLSNNISSLNSVYGGMLSAMGKK